MTRWLESSGHCARYSQERRCGRTRLASEEILERLLDDLTSSVGDGPGQRDLFGADFNAVLSEAALLDSAVSHERLQPLMLERFASGMLVKQPHLGDGSSADESGLLIKLRAGLHAAAAGDTT